jgi:hypothetical protein
MGFVRNSVRRTRLWRAWGSAGFEDPLFHQCGSKPGADGASARARSSSAASIRTGSPVTTASTRRGRLGPTARRRQTTGSGGLARRARSPLSPAPSTGLAPKGAGGATVGPRPARRDCDSRRTTGEPRPRTGSPSSIRVTQRTRAASRDGARGSPPAATPYPATVRKRARLARRCRPGGTSRASGRAA